MQEASSHTENPPADLRANVLLVAAPPDRRALEEILAEAGHNLVPAGSAEEALQLLSEGDFAVVLLAVQMPELDGFATARLIRSREHARHTPIIFLAEGGDSNLPVEQAYALGAVDYLVKPLVPIILRAKVAGFVELAHKTERLRQME